MEITIFARFHARAGRENEVAEALLEVATPSRSEPGCLSLEDFRSVRDPRLFYVHSRWRDEAAFDLHAELPHTVRFIERVQPLIDHPLDVQRTAVLGPPGRASARYSFVALTTTDLGRQRAFWVDQLGFPVSEEKPGEFFIVDAGGLRLCVDLADGDVHVAGGRDPVIGLRVDSLTEALAVLAGRGVRVPENATPAPKGPYAVLRDPDGRAVILTEAE